DEDAYAVMPGGLGSTTTGPGTHANSDIAKDVWVLTGGSPAPAVDAGPAPSRGVILAAGSAANLFEFGTQLERSEGVLRVARNQSTNPTGEHAEYISMEDVDASLQKLVQSAHLVRDHLTPEAWRALAVLEQPAPLTQH